MSPLNAGVSYLIIHDIMIKIEEISAYTGMTTVLILQKNELCNNAINLNFRR